MSVPLRFARVILNGFDSMFAEWQNLTLGAQARFESAAWLATQQAMVERLTIYRKKIIGTARNAGVVAGEQLSERQLWRDAKTIYAQLLLSHRNPEIAQTFFNSCYCYVFGHEKVSGLHAFVLEPPLSTPASHECVLRSYRYDGDLPELVRHILLAADFTIPFEDLMRDVEFICSAVLANPSAACLMVDGVTHIEILESVFYRNKAAYLIGKINCGEQNCLLLLPVLNNERGALYVDTALFGIDDLSILFSFTRAYFMVDIPIPSQYVRFLKSLMPNKETFELYTALGFVKHAKSEFYRAAVAHTQRSDDQYVVAPGTKGMVMSVFTLPSFDYVYKVIKDSFAPPKETTRELVMEKYAFVKQSERAGRMADMYEFRNLAFPLCRFSPQLLDELQRDCASQFQIRGHALLIKHIYVERRMIPLNLYLKTATEDEVYRIMDEYGNAIKQLAAANIFPGDMLLKNFGVTRHGRVVFYDYDELLPLTECHFRNIPNTDADSAASYYAVQSNDVFPEEFRRFFSGDQRARGILDELHPEIYQPDFWLDMQHKIRAGVVHDVFSYSIKKRFPAHGKDGGF
jgi:isocitrate dehydrogenase kinase/phosphatase